MSAKAEQPYEMSADDLDDERLSYEPDPPLPPPPDIGTEEDYPGPEG